MAELKYNATESDWRFAVRSMLIDAGVNGIKQSFFSNSLKRYCTAEQVLEYLEALRKIGKVQKFVLKSGRRGPPLNIWRATTKLMED